MASPLRPPYEYQKIDELNYEFVNRDGVKYHLYFTPISGIYPDMPNTYSFNIEREGTNPHPIDLCIAATVVDVLRHFFETVENAMIMVCDSTDGKQHKRRDLFDPHRKTSIFTNLTTCLSTGMVSNITCILLL